MQKKRKERYKKRNDYTKDAKIRDAIFIELIKQAGMPKPEAEYKFAEQTFGKAWRFDFAFIDAKLAIEIEGGAFSVSSYINRNGEKETFRGGGHTSGAGFIKDMQKYNAATQLGWALLRYEPSKTHEIATIEQIKQVYLARLEWLKTSSKKSLIA